MAFDIKNVAKSVATLKMAGNAESCSFCSFLYRGEEYIRILYLPVLGIFKGNHIVKCVFYVATKMATKSKRN